MNTSTVKRAKPISGQHPDLGCAVEFSAENFELLADWVGIS
jgi:hypothetical protein